MKKNNTLCICEYCIEAIKSHGDRLFVGESVDNWSDDQLICDWCDEEDDTLYECQFY